jgi:hypothetical protein
VRPTQTWGENKAGKSSRPRSSRFPCAPPGRPPGPMAGRPPRFETVSSAVRGRSRKGTTHILNKFSRLFFCSGDCPEIGGSHRFSNDRRRPETTTKRPVLCKSRRIHGTHAGKGTVGYIDPVPIPPICGHSPGRIANPLILAGPRSFWYHSGSTSNLPDPRGDGGVPRAKDESHVP